jgi:hypothetical protein
MPSTNSRISGLLKKCSTTLLLGTCVPSSARATSASEHSSARWRCETFIATKNTA